MSASAARRIELPAEPLVDGATALRRWRGSDVSALVQACQDLEISRWTSVPSPYDEADARGYLRQRYDATFAGLTAPFAIADAPTGAMQGSISLMRFDWEHARGEVGYWLARPARGQGHATRAVRLICEWGFAALELGRIDLLASTGNPASQRVAERAGFSREAILRSYICARGEHQDMVAFGLLPGELGGR